MKRGRLLLVALAVWPACRNDMFDQARADPMEATSFFEDGTTARVPVKGTVARGFSGDDPARDTGRTDGRLVDTFPEPVTAAVLERGRERYGINCAMCHGATGEGDGMIVQRGFPAPPSFHLPRLRSAPAGHFVDVITNGFGVMYPYASRVSVDDRWAITAYIRALQRSRNATLADVPPETRSQLEARE